MFEQLIRILGVCQLFKAPSSGAGGDLLKRTHRAEMFAAIKDIHAGGLPMSSNIASKIVGSCQRFKTPPT